jgi:hypothetical protein
MAKSWKVALALGVGYFLGRTHKTRLALFLAAGAATGGLGGAARRVVTSGGKRLAASESLGKLSPDFGQVVDSLRGNLADAGKAAAKAAIGALRDGRRVSNLSTMTDEQRGEEDEQDKVRADEYDYSGRFNIDLGPLGPLLPTQ